MAFVDDKKAKEEEWPAILVPQCLNINRKPCGPLYLALFPFPHLELKFESDFYSNFEFQSSLLKFSCEDKALLVTRKSCGLYYFLELFFFSPSYIKSSLKH